MEGKSKVVERKGRGRLDRREKKGKLGSRKFS
jgi:hypothetical protein